MVQYELWHSHKTRSWWDIFGLPRGQPQNRRKLPLKEAFLKVFHVTQAGKNGQVRVHQLIERLEADYFDEGCFHIDLSLKKVALLIHGWNCDARQMTDLFETSSFEEAREGDDLR